LGPIDRALGAVIVLTSMLPDTMAAPSPAPVLIRDERELIAALRERLRELGITYETLDTAALLPDGYASKILCEHPVRRMGALSMWSILGTLGYEIALVHNPDLLARFRDKLVTREHPPQAHGKRRLTISLTRAFLRKIGRKGGKARAAAARKRKRLSDLNRRKALKRWHKPKMGEVAKPAPVTPL
jgi:hypothetical protein